MISRFGDKPYVYEHFPGYQTSLAGLSARVDVWNADEKGKRTTWIGAFLTNDLGTKEVGNVPLEMHKFCLDLLDKE